MIIKVLAKEFRTALVATNGVYSKGGTIKIYPEGLEILAAANDNSLSICSFIPILNEEKPDIKNEYLPLYISDFTKFIKLIDMCNEEIFAFEIKNNYIYFKSDKVYGAKFILDDMPPQKLPQNANYKKFLQLNSVFNTVISKQKMKEIIQATTFADASDKIYFYQKDNKLIAELNDRTLSNISNISLVISDKCEENINGDVIIISAEAFNSIITTPEDVNFSIISLSSHKTSFLSLLITIDLSDGFIKYLFNSKIR